MEKKLNITAIIQARCASTRLPNKVLLQINEKTILQIIQKRLKQSKLIDEIIFAIPKDPKEIKLKKHLIQNKFSIYEGSPTDVLDRYYKAAIKYKSDIIIRITSDCPLVDHEIVDSMLKIILKKNLLIIVNKNLQ